MPQSINWTENRPAGHLTKTIREGGIGEDRAPVAIDQTYTVHAGGKLTVSPANGLLVGDSDPDGDTITLTGLSGNAHGTFTDANYDGSFTYVPDSGFVGIDTVQYTITDGTLTATANVAIDIADQPPVAVDQTYTVREGETLTVSPANGLLVGDSDPDGDPITLTGFSGNAHGTFTDANANGSFTYVPDSGFVGTDTVQYTITDGTLTATATAKITVAADQPPVAVDQNYTVHAGQTLTVSADAGLLVGDSDPDGDTITLTKFSGNAHGTFTDANADGSFTYVPDSGFVGTDTVEYTITDGTLTATATAKITVADQAPVAVDQSYTLNAGQALTVTAANGLLAGDSDPDGDAITLSKLSLPAGGKFTDAGYNGSFTYVAKTGFVGVDTIQYTITDGTLTATATALINVACFARGTSIRVVGRDGVSEERPVEKLKVGDCVLTCDNRRAPITWIGHRLLDCARHPEPKEVWPIQVVAGAFGANQPSRDLWLSPGHNVVVKGVLIPISALQNGRSIVQRQRLTVEYWHVELDTHDILFAEGLPTESYLDTGNREAFINGGAFVEAHPDFKPKRWMETCLPLVFEGPEVTQVKAALLDRLRAGGHVPSSESDVHLMADGRRFDPIELGPMRFSVTLPARCTDIRLVSRMFVPAEALADSTDWRQLGVCVGRLQLDGEDVALDAERLGCTGWHNAEVVGMRWTRGDAKLPAHTRLVVIDLGGPGHYWPARDAERVGRLTIDGASAHPRELVKKALS